MTWRRTARGLALLASLAAAGPVFAAGPDVTAGQQIYVRRCAVCHGTTGATGAIGPPLAGALRLVGQGAEARAYVPLVVLRGLSGHLESGGRTYTGVMPPQLGLTSAELAAVSNYVLFGLNPQHLASDAKPYTPVEIDRLKTDRATQADVRALRQRLARAVR